MRTRENSNNYPFWKFKTVDTDVVTPVLMVPFQAPESDNYLLQYLYVQFPTTGQKPTAYRDIKFKLNLPQQNKQYIDIPVSFDMVTSPGHFDPFSGGNSIPNQTFFRSMNLKQPVLGQQTWNLIISDYLGTGNPLSIDILVIGRAVFKKNRRS